MAKQKISYRKMLKALQLIEDDKQIDEAVIIDALKDAIAKAYRKHTGISDVKVRVDINPKNGHISAFHELDVVEEVFDDELEISLEDAKKKNPKAVLGDLVDTPIDITEFGRAAALQAKNVMKQKIREAEKVLVYDTYIDQLDDMVTGIVESVEDKFCVVNIGRTLALMPKSAQIPNEHYYDGQRIRVIITEVNRETKGAQVLVSRASETLIKRLFEKEVPEIYDGIVEIKAIAREAGDRTKMAVISHDENVDAIGACIGQKGARINSIIEEIGGEKIDIFKWQDDVRELIINALAPASVESVFYAENKRNLVVVVDDSQLSLAIGKKGKNARLAVKLTKFKIDIKTISELEEKGIDIDEKVLEFKAELAKEAAERRIAQQELLETAEKLASELVEEETVEVEEPVVEETNQVTSETNEEKELTEAEKQAFIDNARKELAEARAKAEKEAIIKEAEDIKKAEEARIKAEKESLARRRERATYVSKFEKIAGSTSISKKEEEIVRKKRYKKEEEERKIRADKLKATVTNGLKVEYSEEELEEIRRQQELEESNSWIEDDIDFDEFEDFYDDYLD